MEGDICVKERLMTVLLAVILVLLSVWSLFVGVIDIDLPSLMGGNLEQWEIFLVSRLPRLLAILCIGVGMSVAGLIMQQLCMNKFVSPTTGNDFFRAVWNFAGAAVYAEFHPVGTGNFRVRSGGGGNLDLRLVYPEDSVQGCGDGSSGRNHVRQCDRRDHQLSGV